MNNWSFIYKRHVLTCLSETHYTGGKGWENEILAYLSRFQVEMSKIGSSVLKYVGELIDGMRLQTQRNSPRYLKGGGPGSLVRLDGGKAKGLCGS